MVVAADYCLYLHFLFFLLLFCVISLPCEHRAIRNHFFLSDFFPSHFIVVVGVRLAARHDCMRWPVLDTIWIFHTVHTQSKQNEIQRTHKLFCRKTDPICYCYCNRDNVLHMRRHRGRANDLLKTLK